MLLHLAAALSETAGSVLSVLLLVLIFGLPAYPAWKSAQKGISKEDALLPCALCKTPIPATAIVCPQCGKRGGHDTSSKKGKKMYYDIKGPRFLRTYLWSLFAELFIILVIAVILIEGFGLGK